MQEQVLNILSIGVGIVGTGLATRMLYRQVIAERELSKKLKGKLNEFSKFLDNKDLHTYVNVNVDNIRLKELIEEVRQVAEELPDKKREEILDSLEQKSSKGRVNYLNRLLHLSGSNVSISMQD